MDFEVEVKLAGMGVSLVNNKLRREIAYMSITRYVAHHEIACMSIARCQSPLYLKR